MIVLVTGLMRSGTSALARLIHHELEIPMGIAMPFPAKGVTPEYEEMTLSATAAQRILESRTLIHEEIVEYVTMRDHFHGEPWGVKSPFLLPYLKTFRRVLRDREVRVILTRRPVDECIASLERVGGEHLDRGLKLQNRLRRAWSIDAADHVVDQKTLAGDPDRVLADLRKVLQ